MLDDTSDTIGYGASLALAFEVASFAEGVFASGGGGSFVGGAAYGENGIGAFAGVGNRQFAGDAYWVFSAGVSLRMPATAGVICCMSY